MNKRPSGRLRQSRTRMQMIQTMYGQQKQLLKSGLLGLVVDWAKGDLDWVKTFRNKRRVQE